MPRKTKKQLEEEAKALQTDTKTDKVEVKESVQEEENVNKVDVKEQQKEMFTMDISDYGVKPEEAEMFVKNAIKFYFENKSKVFVNPEELSKTLDNDLTGKIKQFEDQIKYNQYVPKRTVDLFLKSLK